MKGICTHLWDSKDRRKELEQIKATTSPCHVANPPATLDFDACIASIGLKRIPRDDL